MFCMRKSFLTLHLPILAVFLMSVDLPTSGSNEFLKQPIKPVTIEKRFDHSHKTFTDVLKRYVKLNGHASTVNYKGLKEDQIGLGVYLKMLESVTPVEFVKFSEEQKLSFWINAYNAYTLKLIIDHYPVESIKDIGGAFSSPWKKSFFTLLGKERSLDEVEHKILRKHFNEPRIHFAINCASIGCPALMPEAYVSVTIEKQLENATRLFLEDQTRNRYDPKEKELLLSKIFDWFDDDFEKKAGTVKNFVVPYLAKTPAEKTLFLSDEVDVEYLDYNWKLNQ